MVQKQLTYSRPQVKQRLLFATPDNIFTGAYPAHNSAMIYDNARA